MSSPYVVAAMCGCFKRESTVNPGIWESLIPATFDRQYRYDNIGGFGLGQWTNVGTPHGRCWNLHEFCRKNGYKDGDGNGQIAFIIKENYWIGNSSLGMTSLTDFLNSGSTNLRALTSDFLACWEGVPGDAFDERYEAARDFLSYIDAHKNDPPTSWLWVSGNYYLGFPSQEMHNNVMCVYNALKGYNLGSGTIKYEPRMSDEGMIGNPWYYERNPFYQSGFGLPNCTCYAWGRRAEITGSEPNLCLSDANEWYGYNAQNKIYPYGSVPKVGAVICFKYKNGGSGHVGVVEEVFQDYSIIVSNSAYGGEYFYTLNLQKENNYSWKDGDIEAICQGFIYLPSDFIIPNRPQIPDQNITRKDKKLWFYLKPIWKTLR